MRELLGHGFSVAEEQFLIVDVKNVAGEVMVYAEAQAKLLGPRRASFRYEDIAALIEPAHDTAAEPNIDKIA